MNKGQPKISIIIPVYREAGRINSLLASLRRVDENGLAETIVVEGAPDGDTAAVVDPSAARVIRSDKGRARQMNAGAAAAAGDILLFLHADTTISSGALDDIAHTIDGLGVDAGAFGLEFDSPRAVFKFFGWVATLRSRWSRVPFGDQGIFVRRDLFERLGGYRDIPLMEDVELMTRIKHGGHKVRLLDSRAVSSTRRWEQEGVVYCTARNCILLSLFQLGVSPAALKRYYPDPPG
jgi:rSAM/selenodomain-associated transferase 2